MELKLPDWNMIPVQDRFDVISQIWDSLLRQVGSNELSTLTSMRAS